MKKPIAFIEDNEWFDIKGHEGRYKINRLGVVMSFVKSGTVPDPKSKRVSPNKSTIRKTQVSTKGYAVLSLCNKGETKGILIHRVLAELFIPNPENKPFINHIDGNKLNNALENLEWCTPIENTRHAQSLGLVTGRPRTKQGAV